MRFHLYRVYLDNSGYERGVGTYYGLGQPIYRANCADVHGAHMEFRARDRDAAKRTVQDRFPLATFYR